MKGDDPKNRFFDQKIYLKTRNILLIEVKIYFFFLAKFLVNYKHIDTLYIYTNKMNSCAKIGCGVYIFLLIIICLSGFAFFSLGERINSIFSKLRDMQNYKF
jgi:hypothetical protein